MKITIIEDKVNRLVFEIDGLGHTFCNALKDELRTNKKVSVATYNVVHPLSGIAKFFVETDKGTAPRDAIDNAIKSLKKKNADFLKAFKSMK